MDLRAYTHPEYRAKSDYRLQSPILTRPSRHASLFGFLLLCFQLRNNFQRQLGLSTTTFKSYLCMLSSDLLEAVSIWSSNVDSASMWIWIGPSNWRIGVDLQLIWLLELQIYTQFALRLKMNRALRSQCIGQSQSATLLTLPLTHCVISSVRRSLS